MAIRADRIALDLYDRAKRHFGVSDDKVSAALEKLHQVWSPNR